MKKEFLLSLVLAFGTFVLNGQSWTKIAQYPGQGTHSAAGFSLSNKGFVTTGLINSSYTNNLYQYDPINNTWTSKTSFPGAARSVAVSFELNGYGYVGLGWNGSSTFSDIYKYNDSLDSWSAIAPYPGDGGRNSMATSLNGKAYVGGGAINYATPYSSQFWEYDPSSDTWTRKADLPGGSRTTGLMFAANGLVYMGFGQDGNQDFNDLWAYNPNTNSWQQKASFPATGRMQARPIHANGKIIVGGGFRFGVGFRLNDYYEYDPTLDTWTSINNFTDASRSNMAVFSINDEGYVYSGSGNNGLVYNDLWKISYATVSIEEVEDSKFDFTVYPNPTKDIINIDLGDFNFNDLQLTVVNPMGQIVYEKQLNGKDLIKINLSQLKSSYYSIILNDGRQIRSKLVSLVN